jgi:hypothetical protein
MYSATEEEYLRKLASEPNIVTGFIHIVAISNKESTQKSETVARTLSPSYIVSPAQHSELKAKGTEHVRYPERS